MLDQITSHCPFQFTTISSMSDKANLRGSLNRPIEKIRRESIQAGHSLFIEPEKQVTEGGRSSKVRRPERHRKVARAGEVLVSGRRANFGQSSSAEPATIGGTNSDRPASKRTMVAFHPDRQIQICAAQSTRFLTQVRCILVG